MHRILVTAVLACAALAPAVAQSPSATLAPTGTLRGVFLGGNPVQGRVDPGTGAASGPVPDLIREFARTLGVPAAVLPAPNAAGVVAALRNGTADIGFLAYDEERAREVDFGAPFMVMLNSYLVKADSPIRTSADVDRAGVVVAAVRGQTQQLFVSRALENAQVRVFETMPPPAEVERLLRSGEVHAFAVNRQRALDAESAAGSGLRALPDSFLNVNQSIVVEKGGRGKLDAADRFVAAVRESGFIRSSIERAKLSGVEVARAETVPPNIAAALTGPDRAWYELQQDPYRRPGEVLAFAQLAPGQTVANLVPRFGYYSRLLSKVVGDRGTVYAMPTAVYSPTNLDFSVTHLRHVALDLQDSGLYDNVVTIQQTYDDVIATPRQLDVIVCVDCYNNLRNPWPAGTIIRRPGTEPAPAQPWNMARVNANMFEALEPGGLYVVSDFTGAPGSGFTQAATLHRADPDAVRAEIVAAGFVFDGASDALTDPADDLTKEAVDGARGSRYLLRFRKPATAPRDKRPTDAANPMRPLYGNTRITGTLGGRTGIIMAFDTQGRYYEYGGNASPTNPGYAYQFGTLIFNARGQACYQDTYPVGSRGTISCHEKFVAKPGVVYIQGPTRAEDPTVYNLIPVVNGMIDGRAITDDDMLTAIAPGLVYPSQVTAALRKMLGR